MMEISVHDKQQLLSQRAIDKAESRAIASFAKFGQTVKSVEIRVQDVNGPRGGVDQECCILVRLQKANDVAVKVTDDSLSKAIPGAINRAARSVSRLLDRRSREAGRLSKFSFEV